LEELKTLEGLLKEFGDGGDNRIFRKGDFLSYSLMKVRRMGSSLANR
jgi:hypothetical protein